MANSRTVPHGNVRMKIMSSSCRWSALLLCVLLLGLLSRGEAATDADQLDVSKLPLVELRGSDASSDLLVLISSGDGGWANLDRQIGQEMQSRGLSVIGLDTGAYYKQAHTADASSVDLDDILEHYLAAWKKRRVMLIGYSRGADAMAFMVNPLPAATAEKLALIVLLGPGTHTNFKFLPTDATDASKDNGPPTVGAIVKMKGKTILCIHGREEKDSACPLLPKGIAKIIELPGGHHFDGNYKGIADLILTDYGKLP